MEVESADKVDQFIEFILFLESIGNLESSLKFPLQFNVHIEFHGNVLNVGDVIVTIMDTVGTIDLEVALHFPLEEISDYNNFASHPLLIYFESINGIEKHSQQSTNNNNGIKQTWVCVVDLLSLIYDNESWNSKGTANTRNKVGGQYPMKAIGELNRNLLSDTVAQLNATVSRPDIAGLFRTPPPYNVLNIAMQGLYNPPPSDGYRRQRLRSAVTCTAMFHEPGAINQRDINRSVFAHSTYTDETRDVNDLRWYSLDNMPANVSSTDQRFEEFNGVVVNSAKIPEPKDVLFKGPRFEWNQWRRFFLDESSLRAYQDMIFKHGYILVTFMFNDNREITANNAMSSQRESNTSVNDEVVHIALLDLSMLLEPNCTSVRCLSEVHAFDVEIMIKNNEFSLSNFDVGEFNKKNHVEGRQSKKSTISSRKTSHNTPTQVTTKWTSTFAVVDITVSNSFYEQYLIYARTSTYNLLALNIIPEEPWTVTCTSPTTNEYRKCLMNTIGTLLKDPKKLNDQNGVESFIDELKVSGASELMKSSLHREIQLYIKENYKGLSIGKTVQSFINRIFIDLVSEMKKTVESFELPHSCVADIVKSPNDVIVYAREAYELKQNERAKKFYLELISTAGTKCIPNYWLLYAIFCSRRLDFDTAVGCVKEVLLVDSGNRIGLFLYAAILLTINDIDNNGEIVLKSVVMQHRKFSEAYALLSVHYSVLKMREASYKMFQKAERFVKEDSFENTTLIRDNLMYWQPIGHDNDPLIKCAILLLELELVELAIRCLHLVKTHSEQYNYYMAVCEYKKGNHLASLELLKSETTTGKYKKVTEVLECLNILDLNESQDILENDWLYVIHSEMPRKELHLVYLKGALHCYTTKLYAKGVEICQIACNVLRTPMLLTLLAKCSIEIDDVKTAESTLNEANVMDIKNEEVWAYLTVVNIKMGNDDEAKVCYTRALECGLKPDLKKEINAYFGKEN